MTVRDIEIQVTPPEKTNVAWVNPQDSILRLFVNGQWRPIGDNGDLSKLEEKGIDTSGTLADTLVEIVDTIPEGGGLVIEGTAQEDILEFNPNEGQPTVDDALAAIEAGLPVYLKVTIIESGTEMIVGFTDYVNTVLNFDNISWTA